MVRLTPMTGKEFAEYTVHLNHDYAASHVAAGNWSADEAEQRGAESLRKLLPQGERTAGHHLQHIVDAADGSRVGTLWYQIERYRGGKEIFVLDIEVFEAYRRRGLARATLSCLLAEAQRAGAGRIRLHVFGDNHGARKLYASFGFEETDVWVAKALQVSTDSSSYPEGAHWSERPALRLVPLEAREFDAFRVEYLDSAAAGAIHDGSGWGAVPAQTRAATVRSRAETSLLTALPLGVRTPGHHVTHIRHATTGALVGSLWYALPEGASKAGDAALHFLRINEGNRRQGYAVATEHLLETICIKAGARRLTAATTARNRAGRSFFARTGFVETGLWMAIEVPPA